MVDRFYPLGVSAGGWVLGATIAGPVAALLFTLATWPRRLAAAMEIDRHFTLRERLSSAVVLTPEERDTPAGAALVADAEAWAGRVKLRKAFPLLPSRRAWQPVPVAALILLAAIWIPFGSVPPPVGAKQQPPAAREQAQQSVVLLGRKLADQQQEAQRQGLLAVERLLTSFQQQADALDRALAEMEATRQRMTCPNCDGSGCSTCDNTMPGSGPGDQPGDPSAHSRVAVGRFYDAPLTDPNAATGPQRMVVVGSADGANLPGTVEQRIEREVDSVARGETDPMSSPQRLPRQHRRHAREYFEQFRSPADGKGE